ncbi:MAG: GUN4 domain-containing protein [Nostoc sp.]|uniref:GUN4 domain-containing protein n=1 Tax=Nostoc sp. TaxID=1180 RepID=UPI002FFA8146
MSVCIEDIENLLIQGEWRKADIETEKLIFSLCNSRKQAWLTPEDIDLIPLDILAHLDRVWTIYSQGRFGFQAQEQIHASVRAEVRNNNLRDSIKRLISDVLRGSNDSLSDKEVLMVPYFFGVNVGWIEGHPMDSLGAYGREKNYEELTFDLSAPVGHLPCKIWWTLNHQAKRISIEALLKKYGILGLSGCLVKYTCSLKIHFFKRVRIACQRFSQISS